MQQDTVEGHARLGRALAGRVARLARHLPLTAGQAILLACFVGGALALGFVLQSRNAPSVQQAGASSADSPAAAAPGEPSDAGRGIERVDVAGSDAVGATAAPATAADPGGARAEAAKPDGAGRGPVTEPKASVEAALDRLAGEIAAINRRLDAVIASDKERASRVATLTVEREPLGRAVPQRDSEPSRSVTAGAAPPPRRVAVRDGLAVHRAPHAAAGDRRAAARRAARPRIVVERLVERPAARRRRVARSIFGLPLHF